MAASLNSLSPNPSAKCSPEKNSSLTPKVFEESNEAVKPWDI